MLALQREPERSISSAQNGSTGQNPCKAKIMRRPAKTRRTRKTARRPAGSANNWARARCAVPWGCRLRGVSGSYRGRYTSSKTATCNTETWVRVRRPQTTCWRAPARWIPTSPGARTPKCPNTAPLSGFARSVCFHRAFRSPDRWCSICLVLARMDYIALEDRVPLPRRLKDT